MRYINLNLSVHPVHGTLWEVHDVFTDEALAWLDKFFDHGHMWYMDRRMQRLSLPPDGPEDPLFELGQAWAPEISRIVGHQLRCRRTKLFLDLPDSEVPRHRDADDIMVMSQIYLHRSNHPMPGTTFLEPTIHTVRYRANSGYINLNTDHKTHQSFFVTNGLRSSVAFQLVDSQA